MTQGEEQLPLSETALLTLPSLPWAPKLEIQDGPHFSLDPVSTCSARLPFLHRPLSLSLCPGAWSSPACAQ